MKGDKRLEQQIAVFGGSGSGKTVLLSCFYGAMQEPVFLKNSLFHVVADDASQGLRLHRNYLGMRDSSTPPDPTRFAATSYRFSLKLKSSVAEGKSESVLHLVWHDYPGEWFEQEPSGPEEASRRVDTFRSLLGSDVAVLMVDAQRLLDNQGHEERYLKWHFTCVRNSLLAMKDDLLVDGRPLPDFPRIWILALSKSDLLPRMDVYGFRDLVVEKAGGEVNELGEVLSTLVANPEAMSVGEDYVILSSAEFDTTEIIVTKRVGVDLIPAIAAVLPLERHVRWSKLGKLRSGLAESLLGESGFELGRAMLGKGVKTVVGRGGLVGRLSTQIFTEKFLDNLASLAGETLRDLNSRALAKQDHMAATLTGFRMDLEQGEDLNVLLRSKR